jgi:UDP-4-amino-4-deoxy-L-arabinose formyltransferase/UDP-glucuronic acid dehydrogenase (UDP-4-keto-hexauronic acid decarboxylating)
MLPRRVWSWPRLGAVNAHGSLLPRYRGRHALNWQLMHGETVSGVTLHWIDDGVDTGDIIAQLAVTVTSDDDAVTLLAKLGRAAGALAEACLPLVLAGESGSVPQDAARATYYPPRRPEDGLIHWARPAEDVRNLVRALVRPWPGAFTYYRQQPVTIWRCTVVNGTDAGSGQVLSAGDAGLVVQCGRDAVLVTAWEGVAPAPGATFDGVGP